MGTVLISKAESIGVGACACGTRLVLGESSGILGF